jgi:hypothetical protein
MSRQRFNDYDGAWKELIAHYFSEFILCFFPNVHTAINWTLPVEFLEQELRQLHSKGQPSTRRVDVLAKVTTLAGKIQHILLHIELQSRKEEALAERLFYYNHGIGQRHGGEVVTLVVLADLVQNWKPDRYERKLLGCQTLFIFPVCKLLEQRARLEADRSLPALIALAQIEALRTTADPAARRVARLSLIRKLYQSGHPIEHVKAALRLLAWMMRLPEQEDLILKEQMVALAQENNMPYVTDMEALARKEGRNEGRIGTLQEAVIDALEIHFDRVPEGLKEAVEEIQDEAHLRQLHKAAIKAPSIEAFAESL